MNRLLIGGICEPFRWGVDDVGLSDLGMASFIRSASPSAVVLTITPSLGRSMTRRSRSLRAARRDRATDRLKAAGLSAYESDPLSALARLGATGAA